MRLLACRNIADVDYITDNVGYRCDTSENDSMFMYYSGRLVVPILLCIILIFPGGMLYGLRKYALSEKLDNYRCKYAYGFLY